MSTTALHLRRADGLEDAERVAADGFDWCTIAAARAAAGDRDGAICSIARALELGATDVVVVRNVVRICHSLGDHDRACRVLAAHASQQLMAAESPSRAWCMVAASWDELGDRDAARYYLEHARARACTAEDLCDVALGYRLLGEPEVSRALVEQAEALATTATDCIDVVDVWLFVLGAPDRGQALLERAVESASTIHEIVRLARVNETLFPSDDDEAAEQFLGAGELLAKTPEDWIDLADAWATIPYDSDAAGRRLDRGIAITSDPAILARIANERRRYTWNPDDPYQSPPPTPRTPGELLPRCDGWAFRPDPARLFDYLRARITPEQLQTIANNDYGWRAQESLALLSEIVATGRISVPLDYYNVRENVELARWSDGPQVDHVERAFACTLICLAGPGNIGGEHESMSTLLDSCIALGAEAVDGMLALFAAIDDDVFIQLGIVLGAARRDPSDPRLEPAIARLVAIDRSLGELRWPGGFVFGRSNFSQRYDLWRSLARTILDHPIPRLRELAERLQLG